MSIYLLSLSRDVWVYTLFRGIIIVGSVLAVQKGSQQPAPSSRQAPRPKGAKNPTKPVLLFQTSQNY